MIRYLIFSCLILCTITTSAQQSADCDKLLKRKIDADSLQQILNNIKNINCFGLDSIDMHVYGNGPVLGSLMIQLTTKYKRAITYADLLNDINSAKKDPGYLKIRNIIMVMNKLQSTKASPDTWESSKPLFKIIDISDANIEKLHVFMLQNQNMGWNYRQLVVIYEQKYGEKIM